MVALATRLVAEREPDGHRHRPAAGPARHRRVQRLRPAAGGHAARRGDAGRGQPDLRRAARCRRRGLPAHQVPARRTPAARAAAHRRAVHRAARRAGRRVVFPVKDVLTLAVWAVARDRARGPLLPVGVGTVLPPGSSRGAKPPGDPPMGTPAVPRAPGAPGRRTTPPAPPDLTSRRRWCSSARCPCSRAPGFAAGCSARLPPGGGDDAAAVGRRADHARDRWRAAARAVASLAAQAGVARTESSRSRSGWLSAIMNFAIYQAFARIPLGIAVTIEFLGPLSVTSRDAARRAARLAEPGLRRRWPQRACVLLAGPASRRSAPEPGRAWRRAAAAAARRRLGGLHPRLQGRAGQRCPARPAW